MKTALKMRAPAKVNLTLCVDGRLPGGLHQIRSVLCPLELSDEIEIQLSTVDSGINLRCEFSPELEAHLGLCGQASGGQEEALASLNSSDNLAYRAAQQLLSTLEPSARARVSGVDIVLKKAIPMEAGLGGGSADAAAVLSGLYALLEDQLQLESVWDIAASLGSDVPAQLAGCLIFAHGTGSKLKTIEVDPGDKLLQFLSELRLVIVKPLTGVSTALAYEMLGRGSIEPGQECCGEQCACEGPRSLVEFRGDSGAVLKSFVNDFQEKIRSFSEDINKAFCLLEEAGAEHTLLAGSGSAVIGFASSEQGGKELLRRVAEKVPVGWLVKETSLRPAGSFFEK